jgi:cell wall-associated NlpC family hydrolase
MSWQKGVPLANASAHRRAIFTAVLSTLLMVGIIPATTAAAMAGPRDAAAAAAGSSTAVSRSASATVVAQARRHLGAPWQSGATGPYRFDCSGLVYRVFADSHLLAKIGSQRSSSGLLVWFRSHHKASRSDPRVGDLVVYGYSGRASHVGIYVGNGRVISTLMNGVHYHGTFAVQKPFIAYLHTGLD